MNIYIYPKEVIAITGYPEAKYEAKGVLPACVTRPRISLELERGMVELALTRVLALQLSAALCKAYPVNPKDPTGHATALALDISLADRYADEHAAELR